MKKIFLTLIIVNFSGYLCFAEDAHTKTLGSKTVQVKSITGKRVSKGTSKGKPVSSRAVQGTLAAKGTISTKADTDLATGSDSSADASTMIMTIVGNVESFYPVDPVQGTQARLVVLEDNGNKADFTVGHLVPIFNKENKEIDFVSIAIDDRVIVEYSTDKDGNLKAQSIKVSE